MKRFIHRLGNWKGSLLLFAALGTLITNATVCGAAEESSRKIAITIDDVLLNGPALPLSELKRMTNDLTGKLVQNHVPAVGFVNEQSLYEPRGEFDERKRLLKLWIDRGLDLGNHTFSHTNLCLTGVTDFESDIEKGEKITSELLSLKGKKMVYFRYPFLATGADKQTRTTVEKFLEDRQY